MNRALLDSMEYESSEGILRTLKRNSVLLCALRVSVVNTPAYGQMSARSSERADGITLLRRISLSIRGL